MVWRTVSFLDRNVWCIEEILANVNGIQFFTYGSRKKRFIFQVISLPE